MIEESFGDEREIDVRLTAKVTGLPVTIAVECRDHSRKQTKEWIDQLIGKFIGTTPKVDRVIAVSRSGFTAGAEKKALEHRILTITLSEVQTVDWPKQFQCIRIAESRMEVTPAKFGVSPRMEIALDSATLVVNSAPVGSLREIVLSVLVPLARSEIMKQLSSEPAKFFPNMAALKHSVLGTEHDYPVQNMAVISENGESHSIKSILVVLHTSMSVRDTQNSFEVTSETPFKPLSDICVTNASASDGKRKFDVSVIQSLGQPTMQVCMTPENRGAKVNDADG
jgi:hypothetical protein